MIFWRGSTAVFRCGAKGHMGRMPRRRLGAGVPHVVNRAINRQWIFESDKAKDVFLGLLASQTSNCQVSIHHWAIMSNHCHLAVEFLRPEDISEYFGRVQSLYSRHHHAEHGGVGTIWQGRFKSVAVQKEDYLNQLGRCIELNPVRAGIVGRAWDYRWPSARAYVPGEEGQLVNPSSHPYWERWGDTDLRRRRIHKEYLLDRIEADAQVEIFRRPSLVVGDDEFRSNLRLRHGRLLARKPGKRRSKANNITLNN